MEECLAYFRKAIADPSSVPPWSEWWTVNAEKVEETFPLFDFVRLKHRGLLGARQILERSGELPKDNPPPTLLLTGSCPNCGERIVTDPTSGAINKCPKCGTIV